MILQKRKIRSEGYRGCGMWERCRLRFVYFCSTNAQMRRVAVALTTMWSHPMCGRNVDSGLVNGHF